MLPPSFAPDVFARVGSIVRTHPLLVSDGPDGIDAFGDAHRTHSSERRAESADGRDVFGAGGGFEDGDGDDVFEPSPEEEFGSLRSMQRSYLDQAMAAWRTGTATTLTSVLSIMHGYFSDVSATQVGWDGGARARVCVSVCFCVFGTMRFTR